MSVLSRQAATARVRRRALMVVMSVKHSNAFVANVLNVSAETVARWCQRYRRDGVNGLRDETRTGRPRIDGVQLKYILRYGKESLCAPHDDKWSVREVANDVGVWA